MGTFTIKRLHSLNLAISDDQIKRIEGRFLPTLWSAWSYPIAEKALPQLITLFCVFFIVALYTRTDIETLMNLDRLGWNCRQKNIHSSSDDGVPKKNTILTRRGFVSYSQIDEKVFRPNNYKIVEETFPIPRLDFISKPTCEQIFDEWLAIARGNVPPSPPRKIEDSLRDAYLLNGYSTLYSDRYSNNAAVPKPKVWDNINYLLRRPRTEVHSYEEDGLAVNYALRDYSLKDMVGFVIGSQEPWIEVQALRSGAKEVYTVEYQKTTIIGTDKINHIHPIEFAERWKEYAGNFDFAISFSSIEHSGLGRYGDPLDPIGDLREVMKVMCLLRKKGLFFVGLPRGRDGIKYNAHRYYGRMRLAMVMTGFEWLATYRGNSPYPQICQREDYETYDLQNHDLYVLAKI